MSLLVSRSWKIFFTTILLAIALTSIPAHAQGCTQCRDNTASTSPATQRAYRHAIILMSTTGAIFFLATLAILKRHR